MSAPTREEFARLVKVFRLASYGDDRLAAADAAGDALLFAFEVIDKVEAERDALRAAIADRDASACPNCGWDTCVANCPDPTRPAMSDAERCTLTAERDEWKRRAEYGQCAEIAKCPTYYDGCHCTAATVQHNIERADKAEAERDAALAALRAQGEIRLDIRHASDLKLRVGILLQLHWKNLTDEQFAAIKAICDEALGEK